MKDWIKSSFRNRIFVTVLLVTLLPMLLCDIFIMQIAMSQCHTRTGVSQT